jgi:hypothetical protein
MNRIAYLTAMLLFAAAPASARIDCVGTLKKDTACEKRASDARAACMRASEGQDRPIREISVDKCNRTYKTASDACPLICDRAPFR